MKRDESESDKLFADAVRAHTLGRVDLARSMYRKLLRVGYRSAALLVNYGMILSARGKKEMARKMLERAIVLDANNSEAHHNLAGIYIGWKMHERAHALANKAIELSQDRVDYYCRLSLCLIGKGEYEAAESLLEETQKRFGDVEDVLVNLVLVRYKQNNSLEAISIAEKCCVLYPGSSRAWVNLGSISQDIGNHEKAYSCFERALSLNEYSGEALFNLSLLYLRDMNFEEGWKLYDYALVVDRPNLYRGLYTRNLLESAPYFTIGRHSHPLVLAEQGLGDQIMFLSVLRDLIGECRHVMIQCDSRIHSIISPDIRLKCTLVEKNYKPARDLYDSVVPVGSLCRLFRKSYESFGRGLRPYLSVDPKKSVEYSFLKEIRGERPLVGISWKSFSVIDRGETKSTDGSVLVNALSQLDVSLVDLQYRLERKNIDEVSGECEVDYVKRCGIDIKNDLVGLSFLLEQCDCLVTVSNATAHIAGAMGLPVILLLSKNHDWRWGMDARKSYWYRDITIVRQERLGDWESVVREAVNLVRDRFL